MIVNLLLQVEYDPEVTDEKGVADCVEKALWSVKESHKEAGFIVNEAFIMDGELDVEEEEPVDMN
jgi:hypothetical protein